MDEKPNESFHLSESGVQKIAEATGESPETVRTVARLAAWEVGGERCGNTIHSNYVSDHRCQLVRGHGGDCLFGQPTGGGGA